MPTRLLLKSSFVFVALLLLLRTGAFAQTAPDCRLERNLVREGETLYYVVQKRAPTLYMISRDLYGLESNWRNLARWNELNAPYFLKEGQRLKIQVAPRLDNAQGTDVLIQAWTRLNAVKIAQELTTYKNDCLVKNEPSVAMPGQTEKVAASEPALEIIETEAVIVQPEVHYPWMFLTSLTTSFLSLETKVKQTSIRNKLYSGLNYGVLLGISRELNHNWGISLVGGVEHVEIESAKNARVKDSAQDLLKAAFELEFKPTESFAVNFASTYGSHLFPEADPNGMIIKTAYLTEFGLGGKFKLKKDKATEVWILGEGLHSMAQEENDIKIEPGLGYRAGFIVDYKLARTVLRVTPTYQHFDHHTASTEDRQEIYSLQIGLIW